MNQNISKSTKVFFKIAGILSFIFFALDLIISIAVIFQISFVEDLVKTVYSSIYVSITEAELEVLMFDFVITALFACVINFFAGRSYINLSKSRKVINGSSKTLIFILVIQFLFGLSILPCLFAFIAVLLYNKTILESLENSNQFSQQTQTFENTDSTIANTELTESDIENTANLVLDLKKQLHEKKITQEEYDKRFNDILINRNNIK